MRVYLWGYKVESSISALSGAIYNLCALSYLLTNKPKAKSIGLVNSENKQFLKWVYL